jgi:hypothetical protein
MSAIRHLFDKVLTLQEGETIILTFENAKDLMSKKVMLFREKKKYEESLKNVANFKSFFIGQEINKKTGIFKLKLSTNGTNLDWVTSAMLKQKGGECKPLELEIPDVEAERIKKLQATV